MTLKELKFIVRASPEHPEVGQVDLNSAPIGVVAEMLAAINRFAKATGADLHNSDIRFFEGSLGLQYLPDAQGQTYSFPESIIAGESYIGGFSKDDPFYNLIHDMENISKKGGVEIDALGGIEPLYITPRKPAGLLVREDIWIDTEISLYGEITDIGGKNPNIHLIDEGGLRTTIYITKQQAKELEIYESYYIRAEAKILLDDETQRRDIRMLAFEKISSGPRISFEELIRRQAPNWTHVSNSVEWIRQQREENDDS